MKTKSIVILLAAVLCLWLFVGCTPDAQSSAPEQSIETEQPSEPEESDKTEELEQPGVSEQPSESEQPEQPNQDEPPQGEDDDTDISDEEITIMYMTINGTKKEVTLEKNSSATALVRLLKNGDITYTASDYGGFEKVGDLGHTLPTNHTQLTTEPGDVILYQNDQIVLFYGSNSWSYTRIGKIAYSTVDELKSFLGAGQGNIQVTLGLK